MKGDMVDVIYSSEGFNGRRKPRYALKCESWVNAYWDIKSDKEDLNKYRVNIIPCRPEEIYNNSISAKEFIKRCEDGEFGAFPKKYNWETQMYESLEDEQMFGRSRKALEIIDQSDTDEDALEALFEEFVPSSGPADTVGGEIVRAINRIVYRWNNDGDQIGFDYGVETVNSSYEYLIEKDIIIDKFDDYLYDSSSNFGSDDYDEFLDQLMKQVLDTLYNRPDLFDEKNEDNSRSGYTYSVEEDTESWGDAEEDEDSDWYFYHGEDEEDEEKED